LVILEESKLDAILLGVETSFFILLLKLLMALEQH